jgi:hypothetical protein
VSFKRQVPAVDLAMYVQAIPAFFKHPSILACPLLAAVMAILINAAIAPLLTNAIGGMGAGLFGILVQLVYLWAFGIAIIQASHIWRGRRGSFDEAWEEGRTKFGGIVLAAIGFQFVVWAAGYIGSFFGGFGVLLGVVAAFFLIYTMPAAAIGGMPGSLAISASIRAVRANWAGSIVLALVFVALWIFLPYYLQYLIGTLPSLYYSLVSAVIEAIILGYMAFPFAKQYDDVAFRGLW